MKISGLISELVNALIRQGDIEVKVGLLSENGNISFGNYLEVNDNEGFIEIQADIDDIKQFKEDIKVLYKHR